MMESVKLAVQDALKAINAMRSVEDAIPINEESILVGDSGILDSLELVVFIASVEQKLGDAGGRDLRLADTMLSPNGPWTVRTLTEYLCARLADA